jgi:hypothetical protein
MRFQLSRYSTTMSSTGPITEGADALIQEPHAVGAELDVDVGCDMRVQCSRQRPPLILRGRGL